MSQQVFSRRVLWFFGSVAIFSLVFSIYSMANTDSEPEPIAKPSALSRSALGYRALARFLYSFGVDIKVRRYSPESVVTPDNVLLLLEPESKHFTSAAEKARKALSDNSTVVVTLPKWSASPQLLQPGWVEPPTYIDSLETERFLAELLQISPDSLVVRPPKAGAWPVLLSKKVSPTLSFPQFFSSSVPVEPLISSSEGVLLGYTEQFGGQLYIVSDPDLLNTHGILQGDNALIAHEFFIDRLHAKALVFDEVIHGLQQPPSLYRELTEPPLWLLSFQLLGLLILAVWAGLFRFGSPLPMPSRLLPGKEALIDSAASLLAVQTDLWPSLQKYHQEILFEVSSACLASSSRDASQHIAALARLTKQRGLEPDLEAISSEIMANQSGTPKRALTLADILYRWRQEMLRGTS